jgi:hypothetical protein
MRGILGRTLGAPEDAIDLTYPSTSNPAYPSTPEKER